MTAIRLWLWIMAKRCLWAGLAGAVIYGGHAAWRADLVTVAGMAATARNLFWKHSAASANQPHADPPHESGQSPVRSGPRLPRAAGPGDDGDNRDDARLVPAHAVPATTAPVNTAPVHAAPEVAAATAASVGRVFDEPAPAAKPPPLPIKLDRESTCLARAIYYEAAHDPMEARIAIAHVAMVRLAQAAGKSTMCSVVFNGMNTPLGCLFVATCRNAGAAEPSGEAWRQSQQIATDLMAGRLNAMTATRQPVLVDATHFHPASERPPWLANVNKLTQVGRFVFHARRPVETAAVQPNREAPPTLAVTANAEPPPEEQPPAQPSVMTARKPLARTQTSSAEGSAKPKQARASDEWMAAGQ